MARILLVDDERDLLELCQLSLESAGHTVDTVAEGCKAVEAAKRIRPEAIGLDWVIPDMSGKDILCELKATPETREIPVLVMSALDGLDSHARRLGASGVLSKPFGPASLLSAFAVLLAA